MKTLWIAVLVLLGSASVSWADARDYHMFVYGTDTVGEYGYFLDRRDGQGNWVETTPEGHLYYFKEKERVGITILLFDVTRNLYVRLTQYSMLLRFDSEPEERPFRRGYWDTRRVLFGMNGGISVIFQQRPGREMRVHWYYPEAGIDEVGIMKEVARSATRIEIVDPGTGVHYEILDDGRVVQTNGGSLFLTDRAGVWGDPNPYE